MSELVERNLEYNSERELLRIPEYGRHIQDLISFAKSIEDDNERQKTAEAIVDLMIQISPQSKNIDDYRERLWRHLFRIADYDLNVVPTIGDIPTPETAFKRPDRIDYPINNRRFRHYGSHVQEMIKKAIDMEPGDIRDGFAATIALYMKLAYQTWNKDQYVSDDIIISDLEALSEGQLKLDQELYHEKLMLQRKASQKKAAAAANNNNNNNNKNSKNKSSRGKKKPTNNNRKRMHKRR